MGAGLSDVVCNGLCNGWYDVVCGVGCYFVCDAVCSVVYDVYVATDRKVAQKRGCVCDVMHDDVCVCDICV